MTLREKATGTLFAGTLVRAGRIDLRSLKGHHKGYWTAAGRVSGVIDATCAADYELVKASHVEKLGLERRAIVFARAGHADPA